MITSASRPMVKQQANETAPVRSMMSTCRFLAQVFRGKPSYSADFGRKTASSTGLVASFGDTDNRCSFIARERADRRSVGSSLRSAIATGRRRPHHDISK
jgi:hypothetical protein